MGYITRITIGMAFAGLLSAQTADELVGKNLAAHGGVEKLKALHSLRMTGKMQQGSFSIQIGLDSMAPNLVKQSFTLMGMTGMSAYDGTIGWRIMPFAGRKDAEIVRGRRPPRVGGGRRRFLRPPGRTTRPKAISGSSIWAMIRWMATTPIA
jgi:hypothetical protein